MNVAIVIQQNNAAGVVPSFDADGWIELSADEVANEYARRFARLAAAATYTHPLFHSIIQAINRLAITRQRISSQVIRRW